jgi:hypothetical protein
MVSSFAASFDIGPFSVKVYICSALFAGILMKKSLVRTKVIWLPLGKRIALLWGLFVLWKAVSRSAHGEAMPSVLASLLKNDGIAFMMFLSIVFYIRTRQHYEFLVKAFIFTVCLSIFFGLMQWLDHSWAWQIQQILNPGSEQDVQQRFQAFLVPGLYATSFTFGYYIAVAGSLLFPLLLRSGTHLINAGQLLITIAGMIILQQRSVLLSFAIVALIFTYLVTRLSKEKLAIILMIVMLLGIGGYKVFSWLNYGAQGQARYTFYHLEKMRFEHLKSDERLSYARAAIALASKNLMFGVTPADFKQDYGVDESAGPHNLFLNALLYYGVPGLILACMMIVFYAQLGVRVWRIALRKEDYLSTGLVLGLVGYLVNAQFHNASFVSGDYLVWWLVALLIVSVQINHQEMQSKNWGYQHSNSRTRRL